MTAGYDLFEDRYFADIDADYMAPLFERLFSRVRPKAALDVGCGNGLFGGSIKRTTGCRLTGIDASEFALEEARKAGYDDLRRVEDLGADRLPFEDASFDFALCKDVFEHLLRPMALLDEIRRALKPGGLLLSHVPNHFTLPARVRFLFTNDIDTYGFFPAAEDWSFPHIRFYGHPGFVAMHREAGFEPRKDLSPFFAVRVPKLWRLPGYASLLGALHRRFPSSFTTGHTILFRRSDGA